MIIDVLSDIHGNSVAAKMFAKRVSENPPDLIIVPGDIGEYSTDKSRQIESTKSLLSIIQVKEVTVLFVFGNWDYPFNDWNRRKIICVDDKVHRFKEISFAGFGGSNITPASSPNEWSEGEAYSRLVSLLRKATNPTVLISHCPPGRCAVDETYTGAHVGSRSVRCAILEFQPIVCICGHVHEAIGNIKLGETLVVNTGALNMHSFENPDYLTARIRIMPSGTISVQNLIYHGDEKTILSNITM